MHHYRGRELGIRVRLGENTHQYGGAVIWRTACQKISVYQVENQSAFDSFLRLAWYAAHRLRSIGWDSHQALLCEHSIETAGARAQKTSRVVGKHQVDPSSQQRGTASSVQSEGVFIEKRRHCAGTVPLFAWSCSLRLLALWQVDRWDAQWAFGVNWGHKDRIGADPKIDSSSASWTGKKRWQRCITVGGDYFERDNIVVT